MERSNIYVDVGQFGKAIDDLSNALARKATDPKILYKRGLAYYRNKEFKKAIKDLYTSLENKPFETYEADIYYHLGISYSNLEMFEKSIPPLSKAIELAYNEPSYIHERAKSFLLTDQFQKSL
jgi:tetratricopeptide (TPR) repeat protein